jgi:predicted glycosyltransferase
VQEYQTLAITDKATSQDSAVATSSAREAKSAQESRVVRSPAQSEQSFVQRKIWIDLDNSPHVPFFVPIIEEIQKRGHQVFLTGRNSYQVCELLELNHLSCKVVGAHWGKNRILKTLGTCLRAVQLLPLAFRAKPHLAVSHGSRSQLIVGTTLGIPTIAMYDYEFTAGAGFFHPDWVFTPQYLPSDTDFETRNRLLKYPGLKEDVYIRNVRLDNSVKTQLGLVPSDIMVTVRPPATEAHYHNTEADTLFDAALNLLLERPDVRVVLLPRNQKQTKDLERVWSTAIAERKIVIPARVVNGVDLVWASDLVISGGGTMNREAAALGVPVYSIFRGRIGAVDKHLASTGRLVLLETVEDVRTKIKIVRSDPAGRLPISQSPALQSIVEGIISIAEHQCL